MNQFWLTLPFSDPSVHIIDLGWDNDAWLCIRGTDFGWSDELLQYTAFLPAKTKRKQEVKNNQHFVF